MRATPTGLFNKTSSFCAQRKGKKLPSVRSKLTTAELSVLLVLLVAGLSSAGDVAGWGLVSLSQAHKILTDLYHEGLVQCAQLGMTLPRQYRWWLTSRAIDPLEEHGYWDLPWSTTESGIRFLRASLPMVEQIYRVLPALRVPDKLGDPKPILDFAWLKDSRIQAVVHYDDAVWTACTWAGLTAKTPILREKWDDRSVGIQSHYPGSEWDRRIPGYHAHMDPEPSAWVVVRHDAWTEHTAGEVWYPNEDVGDKHVYGCGTRLVSGPPLRPTSSWISENVRQVKMGRPESLVNPSKYDARLKALQGTLAYRVFTTVAEWQGIWLSAIAAFCYESNSSILDVLGPQLQVGLLVERDLRYLIGRRGVPALSRLDRVSLGRKRKRSQGSDAENQPPARRTGTHDDRVIQMATWFQKAGVPVHAGWRAVLNFPDETQIVPDAVVCLGDNPLGPGWFRLEYERSAVRRAAVRDKL